MAKKSAPRGARADRKWHRSRLQGILTEAIIQRKVGPALSGSTGGPGHWCVRSGRAPGMAGGRNENPPPAHRKPPGAPMPRADDRIQFPAPDPGLLHHHRRALGNVHPNAGPHVYAGRSIPGPQSVPGSIPRSVCLPPPPGVRASSCGELRWPRRRYVALPWACL